MPRLERAGSLFETILLVTFLSSMMLIAVGQIVLRELFSTGFVWADELIKLMVLWLAMVGSIAAARENRHIRIDALSHILPRIAVEITRALVDIFAAVVCGVIAFPAAQLFGFLAPQYAMYETQYGPIPVGTVFF